MNSTTTTVKLKHPRCAYCHDMVTPDCEKLACDGCMAWQHKECHGEHGACVSCGRESRQGARESRPRRTERFESEEWSPSVLGSTVWSVLGCVALATGKALLLLLVTIGEIGRVFEPLRWFLDDD